MDDESDPRTHAIIGAAMEVHTEMGKGFLEPVYQNAFAVELESRGLPFEREAQVAIFYKETELRSKYRPDFLCFGDIIVELKALAALTGNETAQVINYLKATKLNLALILNFGASRLEVKRIRLDPDLKPPDARNE